MFKRRALWLVENAALATGVILWSLKDNHYAGNLVAFYVSIMFAVALCTFSDDVCKKMKKRGCPVNPKFNMGIEFILAMTLATFGHFIIAAMLVFSSVFMYAAYKD